MLFRVIALLAATAVASSAQSTFDEERTFFVGSWGFYAVGILYDMGGGQGGAAVLNSDTLDSLWNFGGDNTLLVKLNDATSPAVQYYWLPTGSGAKMEVSEYVEGKLKTSMMIYYAKLSQDQLLVFVYYTKKLYPVVAFLRRQ